MTTDKHPPVWIGSLNVEEVNREQASSKVVVAKSNKCCNSQFYIEEKDHQSNKGFYMMRMSLFLVWTVLLACSGVSSTGAFVGEAVENRLKLLERKYGMHATAQKPKKKGTRKKKTRIN